MPAITWRCPRRRLQLHCGRGENAEAGGRQSVSRGSPPWHGQQLPCSALEKPHPADWPAVTRAARLPPSVFSLRRRDLSEVPRQLRDVDCGSSWPSRRRTSNGNVRYDRVIEERANFLKTMQWDEENKAQIRRLLRGERVMAARTAVPTCRDTTFFHRGPARHWACRPTTPPCRRQLGVRLHGARTYQSEFNDQARA